MGTSDKFLISQEDSYIYSKNGLICTLGLRDLVKYNSLESLIKFSHSFSSVTCLACFPTSNLPCRLINICQQSPTENKLTQGENKTKQNQLLLRYLGNLWWTKGVLYKKAPFSREGFFFLLCLVEALKTDLALISSCPGEPSSTESNHSGQSNWLTDSSV